VILAPEISAQVVKSAQSLSSLSVRHQRPESQNPTAASITTTMSLANDIAATTKSSCVAYVG
jgi:hypothetical protein